MATFHYNYGALNYCTILCFGKNKYNLLDATFTIILPRLSQYIREIVEFSSIL
ncbi:MAG: hypothetical protein PHX09_03625 [Clostridia bacterium]|nr:hypothetical protein [Clostridia bacterium]